MDQYLLESISPRLHINTRTCISEQEDVASVPKHSAGILLYRRGGPEVEVFLVHPGGPYWKNKDRQAWSIPKGEMSGDEDPAGAAKREFQEETGHQIQGDLTPLEPVTQAGGKTVHAFACRGDFDPRALNSNIFEMEWPPGSGKRQTFPEVDRGEWLDLKQAREKINKAQQGLLDQLLKLLDTKDESD